MNPKKSFIDFVQDHKEKQSIKELISSAITYYELSSVYNREEETLYIASMVEENMLAKIIFLATEGDEESIESVYDSRVVRCY